MKKYLLGILITILLVGRVNAEPYSVDSVEDDIKVVLRSIARANHFGIIVPAELGGRVSVSIESDRWQEILTALLRPRGYTFDLKNGIIVVEEEPLIQRVIDSNFITGPELLQGLNGFKTERGTLTAFPEGVIVRDTAKAVSAMSEAAVKLGDVLPRVYVQCRFYETTVSEGANIGLDWASLSGVTLTTSSLEWDLASTARAGVVQISSLSTVVRALDTNANTRTLAAPSLVVVSGQKGKILLGQQYPIPQYSFSAQQAIVQVSGFNYRDIGMSLDIEPRVAGEKVLVRLAPSVSTIGGTVTFQGVGGAVIPTINTRQVSTVVSVKSGESVIIGGLVYNEDHDGGNSVPKISKVPLLGRLFRQKQKSRTRQVLTIVVTVTVDE